MDEEERKRKIDAMRRFTVDSRGNEVIPNRRMEYVGLPSPGLHKPGPSMGERFGRAMEGVGNFAKDLSGISSIEKWADTAVPADPNQPYNFINKNLPGAVAAIGSYGLGKAANASVKMMGMPMVKNAAQYVGEDMFSRAVGPIEEMATGGRVFNAFTPFGKTVASTRIMNPDQIFGSQSGLYKIASNTADAAQGLSNVYNAQVINALARSIAKAANIGGAGIRLLTGMGG